MSFLILLLFPVPVRAPSPAPAPSGRRTCTLLREKSSALQQDYRNIKGGRVEEQGVSEIKGFVRALRDNMQGVGVDLHATIAKLLLDRSRAREFMSRLELERDIVEGAALDAALEGVEALTHRRGTLTAVLRLLCLASLTAGGLAPKRLDALRKDVLQAYGSRHLTTLKNLAAAGLLERKEGTTRPWFPAARKALKLARRPRRRPLTARTARPPACAPTTARRRHGSRSRPHCTHTQVVDGMNEAAPDDIAYTYSHSGRAAVQILSSSSCPCPCARRAPNPTTGRMRASTCATTLPVPAGTPRCRCAWCRRR